MSSSTIIDSQPITSASAETSRAKRSGGSVSRSGSSARSIHSTRR